jgi:excinuclease UvrABC ATPase subunit
MSGRLDGQVRIHEIAKTTVNNNVYQKFSSSKTCPECRKSCLLETLLPIYINAAQVSDISESEEPIVLMGQIFALKKELTKMDEKMRNHSDENDKLK